MGFEAVGEHVFVRLHVTELARAAAAGPGDPGLGIDDDPFGLDETFLQERREREQRCGRVATGIRQARGRADLLALARQLGQAIGPAFDETMIAADIDDLRFPGHSGERLARLASGKRYEQQVDPGDSLRNERLDRELARRMGGERGEALRKALPRGRFAAYVDELERGMAGA